MSYARWLQKPSRCIPNNKFAKGVQRNILTNFLKASITMDSMKIFSITFFTLVTVYCTCKIAKDAFRIVLYITTFYMQHCGIARFIFKTGISVWLYICSWYVQFFMLLKNSVFVLWINKLKCSLKTIVSLVLAATLKTVSGVMKVMSLWWPLVYVYISIYISIYIYIYLYIYREREVWL